ncbi:MAG: Wzz/FepE/Etk N-terminal domain-containing protein [Candidatus Margulisbacteria bacterium]|jgi:uncharacterized protein involved in exopolysaccharide biosynthesis|nr:Wzz/FepE/Etk N-terminal domain-containing protein [Candidatus Margulisiibacteriota bacterium]
MQQAAEGEIDLREYIDIARKQWKMIAGFAVGTAMLVLVFSLMQKPIYEAKTTILIRTSGGGTGASLSQFAGLAGLAGISLPSGGGSMQDLTDILQSQVVAARVIDNLNLKERIKGWDDPRRSNQESILAVQGMLKKPKTTNNLIELRVEYTDKELAAEIANGFTDALSDLWNKLSYTEAKRKKEYIESQLPRVEQELKTSEQRLKSFTLLSPRSGGGGSTSLLGAISASQSQGLEIARLSRELDIANSVYTMLRKEYESVKLEESKEIPPFSIIDKAVKPEKKSKPKTRQNVMIGLVLGLSSGVFLAFFQEYWEKSAKSAG